MYGSCIGGYLVCTLLIGRINGFVVDDVECNYLYSNHCYIKPIGSRNYNATDINICSKEDVPKDINFILLLDGNKTFDYSSILKVEFNPPQEECRYGVSLLVKATINNEIDCMKYNFENSTNIEAETHTAEKTICIITNNNHSTTANDNSNATLCQNKTVLWFQNIFTGCYALRFHLNNGKFALRGNTFLMVDYKPSEVAEPAFHCTYDVVDTIEQSKKMVTFTIDIAVLPDVGTQFNLGLWSSLNTQSSCTWYNQPLIATWTTHDMVQATYKKFLKETQYEFVSEIAENENYCVIVRLIDDRCNKHTLWNPPMNGNSPCIWVKRCTKTFESNFNRERIDVENYTWISTNSHILLPTIIVTLMIFTILGIVYCVCYKRTGNQQISKLYVHSHNSDITKKLHISGESNICNLYNNTEIEYHDSDGKNKNVVLLYPKSSELFMKLMADFRTILGRICHCSVHDWYDGPAWNRVAKVGGPDWFTEMLRKGSSVIWVDTPAMRSLVSRKLNSETNKIMEIGDFRDLVFPIIFNLAKRNVQESLQHRKHFIVRLKGFENFKNENDPFQDLSLYTRYLIPQDLKQLCSQL